MTIEELSDFVNETDAGTELHSLISDTNATLQNQLLPALFTPDDAASNWLWNQLFELIAKADDILAAHHFAEQKKDIVARAFAKPLPHCPFGVLECDAHMNNPVCEACGDKCEHWIPF